LSVYVPRQPGADLLDAMTTMGRVLGRLFIGTEDVSEIMVRHGYATKEKAG
jgi:endonuclease YncB( thermonuclease family)